MEYVNYCQLCTIMISLSFEYGVVDSPLDDIRIPRRTRDFAACFFCCCFCHGQMRGTSWRSSKIAGKLKGYLFQLTKLWQELVEQTTKNMVLKQPRSQKKKLEVI